MITLAGSAISNMIFYIVTLIIASVLVVTFTAITFQMKTGIESKSANLEDRLRTSISIINDPRDIPYNNTTGNITFYVKNTGSVPISKQSVLAFLNGTPYTADMMNMSILPNNITWYPEYVLVVTITTNPKLELNQEYSIKIVVQYGISSTLKFRL